MIDLFGEFELDTEDVNKAFDDVRDWFHELNMEDEEEGLYSLIPQRLRDENIFSSYRHGMFVETPTDRMIKIIYEEAESMIKAKYPNAEVTYKIEGYYSTFKVDEATYEKAYQERRRAE